MEKEAALKLCEARGEKAGRTDVCEATLMSFMRYFLESKGLIHCKVIASGGFGCTFSGLYGGKQVVCKLFLSGDRCRRLAADREITILRKISGLSPSAGKEFVASMTAEIPGNDDIKTAVVMPLYELSMCDALKKATNRHYYIPSLSYTEKRQLIRELLLGVKFLHENDITHRDLKPDNIMINTANGKNHPVIIDFGMANSTNTYAGTPSYMPPEVEKPIHPTIDLAGQKAHDCFSLGVIIHLILCGSRPSDEDKLSRCTPTQRVLLEKLLAASPDKRATIHDALNEPYFTKDNDEEALGLGP